jgi:hypothetical protein
MPRGEKSKYTDEQKRQYAPMRKGGRLGGRR